MLCVLGELEANMVDPVEPKVLIRRCADHLYRYGDRKQFEEQLQQVRTASCIWS